MPIKIDLTGQKFGRLTVLEKVGKKNRQVTWNCICDCGRKCVVTGDKLRNGNTKSCGCFHKERIKKVNTKHGQNTSKGQTLIYKIWANMMSRCYNSNHSSYPYYGGRNIQVCERWWEFQNFYRDVGKYRPKNMTLERIDNNEDYKPSNCKWASMQEQSRNTRTKGYCWRKDIQKWQASITVNYQNIYLGCFNYKEDAQQVYLEAKEKYHKGDQNGDKNRKFDQSVRKRKKRINRKRNNPTK